jgi:hypothetical protein
MHIEVTRHLLPYEILRERSSVLTLFKSVYDKVLLGYGTVHGRYRFENTQERHIQEHLTVLNSTNEEIIGNQRTTTQGAVGQRLYH